MTLMMLSLVILLGLNFITALLVARVTSAEITPVVFLNFRSIRLTQEEQVIPVTCNIDMCTIIHTCLNQVRSYYDYAIHGMRCVYEWHIQVFLWDYLKPCLVWWTI